MTPYRPVDAAALSFRLAGMEDIAGIRSLADRIWRESYVAMLSPAQIDYMLAWMYGPDRIADEMARGVLWEVAAADDAPVGFLSVTVHDAATAELNKVYLLPALQGRGCGQTMLSPALAIARRHGCTMLRLRVNKTNTRALAAYERAGFAIVDALVADIGGGFVMDDYLLARAVGPGR